MSRPSTITVSSKGQVTLPVEWRRTHGLAQGGPCDVLEVADGRGSLLITPRAARRGAAGLLEHILEQDAAFPPVERHALPFK
jgi:AbrB family looped-hinge helix DNA binding protein